jgi:hypothetical protein
MDKTKHGLVGTVAGYGVGILPYHPVPIVGMDPFPESIRRSGLVWI